MNKPSASPDGRWVAYTVDEDGEVEVCVRPFPNENGGKWNTVMAAPMTQVQVSLLLLGVIHQRLILAVAFGVRLVRDTDDVRAGVLPFQVIGILSAI